jgi:hypothetical protein
MNRSSTRRYPELSDTSVALGYLLPFHRLRLVSAVEQLRSYSLPVPGQVLRQLIHGHPVDAGTALVLPHSLQRRLDVAALDHPFHQMVVSCAFVSVRRRWCFAAPLALEGFTLRLQRQLQLPGLLAHCTFENHGRPALPSVLPFAPGRPGLMAWGHQRLPPARRYYGLC